MHTKLLAGVIKGQRRRSQSARRYGTLIPVQLAQPLPQSVLRDVGGAGDRCLRIFLWSTPVQKGRSPAPQRWNLLPVMLLFKSRPHIFNATPATLPGPWRRIGRRAGKLQLHELRRSHTRPNGWANTSTRLSTPFRAHDLRTQNPTARRVIQVLIAQPPLPWRQ